MAVPEIPVDELVHHREAGAALIDVRNHDEYLSFHVPGALLIPLHELPERTHEVPKDEQVFVICRTGARSARAVEFLNAQGFNTVNVAGGSMAWAESGWPVATGSEPG